MIPRVPLREAFSDPNLLGTALAGDSWRSWRTLLTAAMGEELRDDEREIFSKLTGRDHEPLQRVDQFAAVSCGDTRHLHCRPMRAHRRIGAWRARCPALCRARSAGGEDHPRLRRGLLRTQSDPEAAGREPNCGCVGADQRHYLGGPPGVVPQAAWPDLCCRHRRRAARHFIIFVCPQVFCFRFEEATHAVLLVICKAPDRRTNRHRTATLRRHCSSAAGDLSGEFCRQPPLREGPGDSAQRTPDFLREGPWGILRAIIE
jgi:hypothetical protein